MSRLFTALLSSFVIMILAADHSSCAEPTAEKARTLRHVVLFKFKDTSTTPDMHPQAQRSQAGPLTCAHPRTILHEYDELAYKDGEEQGQNGK